MYKCDLELNNVQWLICHKTTPYQTNQSWERKYYVEKAVGEESSRKRI